MIQLGEKVKDIVSGFSGIATAEAQYLNGCIQYEITAPVNEKGDIITAWVDSQQIKGSGKIIAFKSSPSGGPQNHPGR